MKLERNQSQTYNQSHTRRPSNNPTSLPRIRKSQDTSIFTISKKHEHEFFLAMLHYNHCYNYLLTFLLSRVIYLHNFIGHVLDSVNSVMSLVDYRLYDVMVRVGFQRKDEGCLGCTSGPPSKLGSITSFGKEMYTLPNNRGTMEAKRQQRWHRQYCAAADTDTIQLYSIQHARLGATYWTIKIKIKLLEATSWVGRFMFRLYYYHIKQITYNQRS